MYKNIRARFDKGYIRVDQLRRYCVLGVITPEQFAEISGAVFE